MRREEVRKRAVVLRKHDFPRCWLFFILRAFDFPRFAFSYALRASRAGPAREDAAR